jgi:predicted nucleic acid-binding protein
MARYTKVLKSLAHNAVGSRRIETVSTSGSSITSLTYVPGSYHYVAAQSNGTNITGNSQNLFGNQIKLSGSSAGGVQLYEATSNGSNYLQLNAPAAITSNFVLTLPNGPPSTSGYALVSTDAGVLSWSAFSGGNTYITGLAYAPSTQKITATLSDSSTVVQSPSLEEFGDSISIKGTNEGHVNLYEKAVNGSAYVSLRAPVDMGTNPSYIISLPVADGATGQVMARGSGGQLTWVNNDDANYYVTGGTYDSSNDEIDFSGNTGFPAFSVDTSAFAKGSIAGASTYVPYFTAASALTGTNTFRWDNANGFLTLSNATASTATHTGHPLLVLENTNADAYPAGIKLYKNSASSAANDLIGLIRFYANDNAGTPAEEEYARIEGEVESSTAGAEVGKLSFYTVNNGSFARRLWMSGATTTINSNTEITGTLSTTGVATLGNNSVTNTQSAGNDSTRIATTAFVSTAVDNAVASSTQYYNTFYNSSQGLVGSARLQTDASNNIILSGTSNIAKTAADFQSTLGVSGALTVSGNSSLKGTLGVASTTTLSGATTIEAATDIIGNLTIKDGGYATPMWKMTATQGAGKVAMIDSGSNASTPQFFPILQLHNEAQDVDPGGGGAVVYADMPTIHFRKLGPRNAVNSANTTAGFRFLASGLSTAAATTTQKQFLVYTYQPDESSGTPAEIAKLDSTGIFTATTFAGELSGTIDSATTATTQSASNNSTKVATTAYVDAAVSAGGGGGISFNGSTANGLVTYGNASTADVEANLTFDGSDLSIAASGKLKVVNASSDYWSIYNQSNGKMRIDQGTTQRVLASSGEFQFANDIIVDNDLLIGSTATVNGARLHVQGEENLLANFFSTDGIGEIRIGDNYNTGHKYTRILSVGSQLKLMPDDGAEMMNLDGSAYKTTLLGETGGNSPKLMFDNPDASNDIQLTQADSGWFGLSTDGGSNQHFVARTGNIGIGTESPTNLLTVSGNASPMRLYGTSTGKVEFDVSTTGDYTIDADDDIRLDAGGQDIVLFGAGSEFGRLTNSSQDFIIENTQSDKDIIFKAKKSSTSTEIMRIDGSVSRVGIGTAAPAQTLDVRGTTLLSGATDTVPFEVFAYGAGTSAMHITSGSATGLGTATPLGKLHINAGAYQMVFQRDTHHHTIVKGNSDDTLIFATGAPGSHTTRFKIMPTGIDVVNNAMITGTLTTTGVATLGNNSVTNTQSSGDNSTRIATTEFVTAALAAGGYGNVTKVGTPANNQIGVWTGDGTIEGANTFAWDNSTLTMTNTGDTAITLLGDANRSGENSHAMAMRGKWDGTVIGTMMIMTGPDTTNKDDGQLAFYTASAGTQAERMRIDETGNVGIGTSAPDKKLDVRGDSSTWPIAALSGANTHGTGLQLYNSNTTVQDWAIIGGGASHNYAFRIYDQTDAMYRLAVDRDGKVGIGGTNSEIVNPGALLHINSDTTGDVEVLRLENSNASTTSLDSVSQGFRMRRDGDDYSFTAAKITSVKEAGWTSTASTIDASLTFSTLANESSLTEKMRITSAGRVGIGTAAPTRTLDVRGDILLSGGTLITGTLETTGKGTIDNELQINGGGDSTNTHFNLSDAGTNIISHASTGATTIRGNGASGDSMFKVESDGDVIHYYNSIFSGSVGVGGLITASGGVTLPATSDNFTMGGNAVNDILIDGDSYPGSSQDDYLITAKYLNTVSGAIVAAGGGGTIGGSIADNQIAFGATTANSIEGSDNLQFDGNNMTLAAGKHIYFNDTDASIHAGADSRLDVKGDSITFASGSTEVMRVNGGGLGIGTSAPTQPLDVITGDGVVIRRENTDSAIYGPSLYIDRKRATGGDLSSGDLIGNITFRPFETDYDNRAATISAAIEGTVTTDTTPGRLMFSTAAAGANTVTERMRIDSTGDVSINNSGKLKVVNASSDYWAIYNQANGKMRIDQGTTQRVLASSGEFQFANDIIVDNDLIVGATATANGAPLHVVEDGTNNLVANFLSADGIAEIRIGDNSKYTRLLTVGSQFKLMPDDGAEMMNLDGSAYKTTLLGETGGNSPKLVFDNPDASNDIQLTQADSGWFGLSSDGGTTQHFVLRTGNVGIGTESPGGKVDIVGSSGTVSQTPDTDAEELVIRNNHRAGISILSSDSSSRGGYIVFGGATDANAANIQHNFNAKTFSFQGQNSDMELRFASANNVEAMRIDTSQNVGIGTTGPSNKLDVLDTSNPQLRLSYDGSNYVTHQYTSAGNYKIITAGGNRYIDIESNYLNIGTGQDVDIRLQFNANSSQGYQYWMEDEGRFDFLSGSTSMASLDTTGLTVTGTVSATAKSFNIEHPLYKDKRLVHGSLEGPEHGIYIRGSIESKEYGCLIELPEYWDAMCEDYTVQLTPHGPYTVYIKEKQKDKVMVASTSREYKFDYYIVGSRTDETLEVVQDG